MEKELGKQWEVGAEGSGEGHLAALAWGNKTEHPREPWVLAGSVSAVRPKRGAGRVVMGSCWVFVVIASGSLQRHIW